MRTLSVLESESASEILMKNPHGTFHMPLGVFVLGIQWIRGGVWLPGEEDQLEKQTLGCNGYAFFPVSEHNTRRGPAEVIEHVV